MGSRFCRRYSCLFYRNHRVKKHACQLQLPGLSDVCLVGMLSMRATGVRHKISSKSPSGEGFLASGSYTTYIYIYTCILYIYKLSQTFANVF